MTAEIYEKLVDALDRLPNGFPRTPSHVELRVLEKIFSQDEAWLASQLTHEIEPAEVIAARVGLSPSEASERLKAMARRGLVWFDRQTNKMAFRLAPFVVGIFEAQLERLDHEFAHLATSHLLAAR
jgi:hypothetical protein